MLIMSSDLCRIHSNHNDLFWSSEARTLSTDEILRVKNSIRGMNRERVSIHVAQLLRLLATFINRHNTRKMLTQKTFLQAVVGSVI